MHIQALRGTTDLLAPDVARLARVERAARRLAKCYGYQELRTPILEDAQLFLRAVGETSDIVQKEMFRFKDRGEQDIVLRPEGTASVVRAYLEHNLHKTEGFARLLYLGPMFRAERPQAGRLRQFHQYGVEAIGSHSPWVDAEAIVLCVEILRACGVKELAVWLSSMGCRPDQERSRAALRERLRPRLSTLCKECQGRFEKNVFRVLDCKHPACQEMARTSASSPFLLCGDCQTHFGTVREGLTAAGVMFDDTKVFARGLDYYTRTVFEVRAKGLGAQDAVAAGGRYDHLVEELGGPSLGAFGFAAGMERVLMAAGDAAAEAPAPARQGVYLAVLGAALMPQAFRLAQQVRARGMLAVMDPEGKSLKAQLREADKWQCRFVAILGEKEQQAQALSVKDLEQGTQQAIAFDAFPEAMAQHAVHTQS